MIKQGDRVKCTSWLVSGTGEVFYVDHDHLYASHLRPIQVEMDDGMMTRFSLKEVKRCEGDS